MEKINVSKNIKVHGKTATLENNYFDKDRYNEAIETAKKLLPNYRLTRKTKYIATFQKVKDKKTTHGGARLNAGRNKITDPKLAIQLYIRKSIVDSKDGIEKLRSYIYDHLGNN